MTYSASSRLLLGGALTLLLAACGQSPSPVGNDPYANGADYPWEYTADRAIQPLALGSGDTSLSFGNVLKARNGWGPTEVNQSNGEQAAGDGRPLTLNGQVYSAGLGMHAGGEIKFHSPVPLPHCARLTAEVGVDDEVGSRGSVVFQVYADNVKLFDSGVMTGSSVTRKLDVDLGSKKNLRFVVTDAGDGKNYDHADWVNPMLSCPANSAATLSVDPSSLSIFHKHSATLKATFGNLAGPVDLRLEVEAGKTTGLQLQTTRVDLGAGGSVTQDVVIAAPGLPEGGFPADPALLTASYRLVASQNGQDVASAPVTITEKLLTVITSYEPQAVTGRVGETRRVTVTVKVSPPLNGPVPIGLLPATSSVTDYFSTVPVGVPYGDGGTMHQDFDLTLHTPPFVGAIPPTVTDITAAYNVLADNFAGYRIPFYNGQFVSILWNIIH